jgi:hypothetical protein
MKETFMNKPERVTPILELAKFPKSPRRQTATEAEAQAMDEAVVRIVGEIRTHWLRLGQLIDRVIVTRAWEVLEFPNVHTWMTARLGESISNAYSALRSVKALDGVPEKKLMQIGERNAHALTYLPFNERKTTKWIGKAIALPTKEFKQEVQMAIEQKTGLSRERLKTFSIALPEAVYDGMHAMERKVARALSIDIEKVPGNKIQVWEALVQSVLQTEDEALRVQIEGT